jgi:hypothetical protein
MITVILTHEVKNFSDWMKVYDADAENRVKAGLHISSMYRSVDNPNMITLVGEAPGMDAVKGFMSNPDLKAAMEKGGVIGVPDVKLLNKV